MGLYPEAARFVVIVSLSAAFIAILFAPLAIVFEFLEYNIMTDMEIALELMTDDEKQLLEYTIFK